MLLASAFAAAFVALNAVQVSADLGVSFHHLKDVRDQLTFAPYTPEQKTFVASQAQELMNVYVHSYIKKDAYGVDANAGIADIVAKAASMDDQTFHYSLAKLFLSLRDFHTNYYIPGSHSCFRFLGPFVFDFVASQNPEKNPVVAVRGITEHPEFLAIMPDAVKSVKPGDILISVDGKPFYKYFQEIAAMTGGANAYGGQRGALALLQSRNGKLYPAPEKDEITFQFKRGVFGKPFSVKVPIVAYANNNCLADAPGSTYQNLLPVEIDRTPKLDLDWKVPLGLTPEMEDPLAADLFPNKFSQLKYQPTKSSIVGWTIYQPKTTNLGVIRLSAFTENGDSTYGDRCKNAIRDLLVNELKDAAAVVIDVRGNGGGWISLGEGLTQFFAADFRPGTARALISKNNELIFVNNTAVGEDWKASYLGAKPGDKYSVPIAFTSFEKANDVGQVWLKPVGILTDANCYSSCDIFSAAMQDNKAGIVFGEDGTTGAGGANVITHSSNLVPYAPTVYRRLPYTEQAGRLGVSDMRVGWRQSVRTLLHNGELIEDTGIISDAIIRPTIGDITGDRTGRLSQFEYMAARLKTEGLLKMKQNRFFKSSFDMLHATTGAKLSFSYEAQNIRRLELRDQANKVLGTSTPANYFRRATGSLALSAAPTELGYFTYHIYGYDLYNSQVLKTRRQAVIVPLATDFFAVNKGTVFEYGVTDGRKFAGIYNAGTKAIDGWQVKGKSITTGSANGVTYANDIDTSLSIFVKLVAGVPARLSADITYDTEVDYDYLYVTVKKVEGNGKGETQELYKVSGKGAEKKEWSLDGLEGNVEISFRFTSDGGVTTPGCTIQNIRMSA
ncbi:hypothetical protein HDU85_006616 [Gaertneriomyces sp. JEL0708]|nr:hypothetical protein HDU85_006616 [Gaertneriomyces sp. JEL0708]